MTDGVLDTVSPARAGGSPAASADTPGRAFPTLNRAYGHVFRAGRLTVGLVVPIARYDRGPVPSMAGQVARIQRAEALGFAAVWLRDVPFLVPSFGDAGQVYDPFVYLGLLAGQTERIGLGVASLVLPLRHPVHVAKAAASVDVLSGGRLLLGVASGDRPQEYPALNLPFEDRGRRFREGFAHLRGLAGDWPHLEGPFGRVAGDLDLLPKPVGPRLPLLLTGGSQQSPDWIARHGDGWMTYPRPLGAQAQVVGDWRARTAAAGGPLKPAMQPLYVDLLPDPGAPARPIHLGLRTGVDALRTHLRHLEAIGINHVALNLRFNQDDVDRTLERLADEILVDFASGEENP